MNEAALMHDEDAMNRLPHKLKALGAELAMDDFGPGTPRWQGSCTWAAQGFAASTCRTLSNPLVLQCVSRVERVTGIEPALSAWETCLRP